MSESSARRIFLALFFLSGFSALLYQVLWFRVLHLILGATVLAAVTTLGAFMTGLALGSGMAARYMSRIRRPLRAYTVLEIVVGLTALLSPLALEAARGLYVLVAPDPLDGNPLVRGFLRAALAFLVLLVPTTAMGATLPVLVQRFVRSSKHAGARIGALYAANIWGGVFGVALSGFLILPLVGVQGGLAIGAVLTLLVALIALLLSHRLGPPVEAEPASVPDTQSIARASLLTWVIPSVFFLTGFCSFVYEVLWTRLLVLHIGSSGWAFSVMLMIFLLGLALGGTAGGWAADRVSRPLLALAIVEAGVGLCVLVTLIGLDGLPTLLETAGRMISPHRLNFAQLVMGVTLGVAPFLLPTTILIGASFPLGAKAALSDPRHSGRTVGRLYAWNTTGNIIGALCGGLLILRLFGAQGGLLATAILNGLAGALLLTLVPKIPIHRKALGVGFAVALLGVGGWFAIQAKGTRAADYLSEQPNTTLLYLEETPQGTITITQLEEEAGVWKSLEVDAVNVAGTAPGLIAVQKLQGHLPLLLHPNPKKILHIGFGSGGTAKAVATHPSVEKIHIAEINPGILRASAEWFSEINEGVLDDPRVEVAIEDGRNFLLATPERYDVILSDAVHPRYAGNSSLYTSDYFAMAKERLEPDGLLSLWLPIYGVSPVSLKMILRSVQEVFPNTSVWYINSTVNEFCIVIGRKSGGPIDTVHMAKVLAIPSVRQDLAPVRAADPLHILDYLIVQGDDLHRNLLGIPLSRDDRPVVEYLSARTLDRTATWYQNFEFLRSLRRRRPDLIGSPGGDFALQHAYNRLYASTTSNLAGQSAYLLSGHSAVPEDVRTRQHQQAVEWFGKADALAPNEREPWEYFGLPESFPKEWTLPR